MSVIYVRSTDGLDTDDGSTWALAKATVAGAIAIAVSGDDIYISKVHSEALASEAGIVLGSKDLSFYVVDEDNLDALVSGYQSAGNGQVKVDGYAYIKTGRGYFYGLRFTPNDSSVSIRFGGSTSANGLDAFHCKNCLIDTGGGAYPVNLGYGENVKNIFEDCDFDCSLDPGTDLTISIGYCSEVAIIGGSVLATDTYNAGLFNFSTYGGQLKVVGFDMSAQDVDLNLVSTINSAMCIATFERCILPASWTGSLFLGTIYPAVKVDMYNCWYEHDTGLTEILFWIVRYEGEITQEQTTVRTATYDGTNKYSAKMVSTSANCGKPNPLKHSLASVRADWATLTTVDVYFTSDTALDDSEFWIEGDFPSSATSWTNNKHFSSEAMRLSTPTGYISGQGTWTSGKTYTYKATLTLSGCEEGEATIYACVGKTASDLTVYVCPDVGVS